VFRPIRPSLFRKTFRPVSSANRRRLGPDLGVDFFFFAPRISPFFGRDGNVTERVGPSPSEHPEGLKNAEKRTTPPHPIFCFSALAKTRACVLCLCRLRAQTFQIVGKNVPSFARNKSMGLGRPPICRINGKKRKNRFLSPPLLPETLGERLCLGNKPDYHSFYCRKCGCVNVSRLEPIVWPF